MRNYMRTTKAPKVSEVVVEYDKNYFGEEVNATLQPSERRMVREYREGLKELQKNSALRITKALEQSAIKAAKKVDKMINSNDERIATVNAHFAINHAIGKATNKSYSRIERINIDVLAD